MSLRTGQLHAAGASKLLTWGSPIAANTAHHAPACSMHCQIKSCPKKLIPKDELWAGRRVLAVSGLVMEQRVLSHHVAHLLPRLCRKAEIDIMKQLDHVSC